jgi:general secretion pathway protein I
MKKLRRLSGFTLMEVLVALVIISIAFTAIFMAISVNARSLLYLKNKTAADWIALNIITEAQIGILNINHNTNEISNKEYMFNQDWYWDAKVESTSDLSISRIDVEVKKSERSPAIIHVSGYLRNAI